MGLILNHFATCVLGVKLHVISEAVESYLATDNPLIKFFQYILTIYGVYYCRVIEATYGYKKLAVALMHDMLLEGCPLLHKL